MSGNPETFSGKTKLFFCRRFHRDLPFSDMDRHSDFFPHRIDIWRKLWLLRRYCNICIYKFITGFAHFANDVLQQQKGRNILIGIIVFIIALSSCVGLSIRQAAQTAKSETLEGMSVTATISFDRKNAMSSFGGMTPPDGQGGGKGGFDRDQFSALMGSAEDLTIEEYEKYAAADSVEDFYYTITASLNGSDSFGPVTDEEEAEETEEEEEETSRQGGFPGGFPGGMPGGGMMGQMMMGADSDFSIEGVSSDSALTSFVKGTASITDGVVFDEGTTELECIISEELAIFNSASVGDTITLTNPNNEEETYSLKITGIYSDTSSNQGSFSIMGSASQDPANKIYMSAAALDKIIASSEENTQTVTDEDTGREFETALRKSVSATYSFADTDSYYAFEEEARELGLDESYTISSQDINEFENSLVPLNTLSTMAGYFLAVILAIGAVILIVLNIFNVRERKYEIGVLTAMGMKKGKVALQFIVEIFAVTMAAVIVGAAIGTVASVPVANALLANQIESQSKNTESLEESFGRPGNMGEGMPDMGDMPSMPEGGFDFGSFGGFMNSADNYVSEISSATNLTVILQMLGIAILLTLVSGAVSMLFVMRYEPLKILANRD